MGRLTYYTNKIKWALEDHTLGVKVRRKLTAPLQAFMAVALNRARQSREDSRLSLEEGFADHRQDPRFRRVSPESVQRVIRAYLAAKAEESKAPPAMQIRGLWSEWRDRSYRTLMEALSRNHAERVAELLDNFEREDFAFDVGAGSRDYLHFRRGWLVPRTYIRTVWCGYRDKTLSLGLDASRVQHPMIGNPAGLLWGKSVIQSETWRHAFNALEIAELLRDVERPVIVEIGGGFGSQAHQTLRLASSPVSKYVIFDIPEVAAVASAFLLTAFPEKHIRLFGEAAVKVADAEAYDIAVFPHFTINALDDLSVDLVFNTSSFSEMDRQSAQAYLDIVNRACRKYFRHTNHEERFVHRNGDGYVSRNMIGSEMVPDRARFKRIYKRPRVFGRPEDTPYTSFGYLYERLA